MARGKVIITDFITEPLDDEQRTLGDLAEVTALDAHSEDELIGRIEDADALMVYHCIEVTPRVVERGFMLSSSPARSPSVCFWWGAIPRQINRGGR